jgi:hypothetical protein
VPPGLLYYENASGRTTARLIEYGSSSDDQDLARPLSRHGAIGASPLKGEKVAGQVSPLAGKTIEPSMLVNVPRLVTAYFTGDPDPTVPSQRVAFGTSGHRGSAFDNAFNEALAISQAICRYRSRSHITGPLFVGPQTEAIALLRRGRSGTRRRFTRAGFTMTADLPRWTMS